jgi:phage FluMu protein Com
MLEKVQTKRCTKCKKVLSISEFSVRRSGRDIRRPKSQCKACNLATLQQGRDAQPGFTRASIAEYQRTRWRTHQPKKFLSHVKRVEDIRSQVFGNYTAVGEALTKEDK